MSAPDDTELEARIGYVFRDRTMLAQALTHVSATTNRGKSRHASNERLEFLGDRVLGLAVAELLVLAFPHADEGELTRRLASLVRKETCAEVASAWEVGAFLKLAAGEARSGGRTNPTILGDVCEAILGAVFLDAADGYAAARRVVELGFGPLFHASGRTLRDAKSTLQEWALARGRTPPFYRTVARTGPDHAPHFLISVVVEGHEDCEGRGRSKREAEQVAASAFLAREGIDADAA